MKITSNSEKLITNLYARSSAVLASGDLGGGTATLGYRDSYGNFVPLLDENDAEVTLTIGAQLLVEHGKTMPIYVKLENALEPNLEINVSVVS